MSDPDQLQTEQERQLGTRLEALEAELETRAANLALLFDGSRRWRNGLQERERAMLAACECYAANHSAAGVPGHSLMMFVAKLAMLLDEAKR